MPEPSYITPAQMFDERTRRPEIPMPEKTPADYYNENFRPKVADKDSESKDANEASEVSSGTPAPQEGSVTNSGENPTDGREMSSPDAPDAPAEETAKSAEGSNKRGGSKA